MSNIKVAVAGVGNSTSSLVQAIVSSRRDEVVTGVRPPSPPTSFSRELELVAAFDVDERKVGRDLSEAILAEPNCTTSYVDVPPLGVTVAPAPVLDGLADHVRRDIPLVDDSQESEQTVADRLAAAAADVLVCQLPGGSTQATQLFARAALQARVAFVNCNPEPVANDPTLAVQFASFGVALLGDDIKSQLGTTVLHRTLLELFERRGVEVTSSYQLNYGGNNDFRNMLDLSRFTSKQRSKHSAISAATRTDPARVELISPGYIESLRDHKVAYVHIEGTALLGMNVVLEARLQVEDSPNSAGVAIEALRVAGAQRAAGVGGAVAEACSPFFKRPPQQIPEREGLDRLGDLLHTWDSRTLT
jgi:myo-inositol-1-phosphate synthase